MKDLNESMQRLLEIQSGERRDAPGVGLGVGKRFGPQAGQPGRRDGVR
jgi:hypothetical protein